MGDIVEGDGFQAEVNVCLAGPEALDRHCLRITRQGARCEID